MKGRKAFGRLTFVSDKKNFEQYRKERKLPKLDKEHLC